MRFKSVKKFVAAILAATMVMSSALTVCATDASGNDASVSDSDDDSDDSGEEYVPPTYEQKMSQPSDAPISVAGVEVRTSVAGVYAASSVLGTAVKTSVEDVKTSLGLEEGQTPVIIIYDVDAEKSVNAMASINVAADSMGADVVASLHIELGAKEKGEWITLSDGNVALVTGLPKDADTSLTYSVLCVQRGGIVTVLEDLDTNPETVTFAVNTGVGAYAIVAE